MRRGGEMGRGGVVGEGTVQGVRVRGREGSGGVGGGDARSATLHLAL